MTELVLSHQLRTIRRPRNVQKREQRWKARSPSILPTNTLSILVRGRFHRSVGLTDESVKVLRFRTPPAMSHRVHSSARHLTRDLNPVTGKPMLTIQSPSALQKELAVASGHGRYWVALNTKYS